MFERWKGRSQTGRQKCKWDRRWTEGLDYSKVGIEWMSQLNINSKSLKAVQWAKRIKVLWVTMGGNWILCVWPVETSPLKFIKLGNYRLTMATFLPWTFHMQSEKVITETFTNNRPHQTFTCCCSVVHHPKLATNIPNWQLQSICKPHSMPTSNLISLFPFD